MQRDAAEGIASAQYMATAYDDLGGLRSGLLGEVGSGIVDCFIEDDSEYKPEEWRGGDE